jgi:hypothetical protein
MDGQEIITGMTEQVTNTWYDTVRASGVNVQDDSGARPRCLSWLLLFSSMANKPINTPSKQENTKHKIDWLPLGSVHSNWKERIQK